jgi:oxepin-CoA hydrolase/3-oxo-5,6-dehydrosuberyl-CoA semialdehyde dehydrogenase
VLANTGLENLRFQTPLYPGDSMRVELTVKSKSVRDEEKGEVRWASISSIRRMRWSPPTTS